MGLSAAPYPIVMDASFAVDGVGGDPRVTGALERWVDQGRMILVPAVFWPELANALFVRRRLTRAETAGALRAFRHAGVETADRGSAGVEDALDLADEHRLTVYDAMYLALVLDVEGELATRDLALARAATAELALVFEDP